MLKKISLFIGMYFFVNIALAQSVINEKEIHVSKPISLGDTLGASTVQAGRLINIDQARIIYNVKGENLTVAVLDTGLRTTHIDFTGRIIAQKNFTSDNNGNVNDASDGRGHGTHVTGIIAGNKKTIGIAPKANIIPLKVLDNGGNGSFASIRNALDWIIREQNNHNIRVVNISISDEDNYKSDSEFVNDTIRRQIKRLRSMKVAVVVSAGNEYNDEQGMGYPAIFRESISVGAVYDSDMTEIHDPNPHDNILGFVYRNSRAAFFPIKKGAITPFSQRLHFSFSPESVFTQTDVLAPGALITSTGIRSNSATAVDQGTSQAAPIVSGVILLMQQHYKRKTGNFASIDVIENALRNCKPIFDGDDEIDNVANTNKSYVLIDAKMALDNIDQSINTIAAIQAVTNSNSNYVIKLKDKEKYKHLSSASETKKWDGTKLNSLLQKSEELDNDIKAIKQKLEQIHELNDEVKAIKQNLKKMYDKYEFLAKSLKFNSEISRMKSILLEMNSELKHIEKDIQK